MNLHRVSSIDVFRAFTMLCMIFVNDFWYLIDVPNWLLHARGEDFIGFSDYVFPAFLFAVGLSIPFAIENRFAKGDSHMKIAFHISLRTFSLIVMGLFLVNHFFYFGTSMVGLSRSVSWILMVTGFFLIWNMYPKSNGWKKYLFIALQFIGVGLLIFLFVVFRDRSGNMMEVHWWGVLAQIGWAYFPCALIYLVIRNRLPVMVISLLAFILFRMGRSVISQWLDFLYVYIPGGHIPGDGAFHCFTMSGIIVSLLCIRYGSPDKVKKLFAILISAVVVFKLADVVTYNWWNYSFDDNTPPFIFTCLSASVLLYVLLYWLTDIKGKKHWFNIIKPAGVATLTCYLLPDVFYSLFRIFSIEFPDVIRTYPLGLLKSLTFALIITWITALLGKLNVTLKI